MNFEKISKLIDSGAEIKKMQITSNFTFEQYQKKYGDNAFPLFSISSSDKIEPFSLINPPSPQAGDTIIALFTEDADSENSSYIEPDPNLSH